MMNYEEFDTFYNAIFQSELEVSSQFSFYEPEY